MLWLVDCRVDWKVCFVWENHLAALVTEPDRNRGCEKTLTGDTPVPFHLFCPVLKTLKHVFRVPFDVAGGFDDFVSLDFDEPLAFGEDFNRSLASPASSNSLLNLLLVL